MSDTRNHIISKRKSQYFSPSGSYLNDDYPCHYNSGGYFDRTFSYQHAVMHRERLIRRVLSFVILIMMLSFMIYIWFIPIEHLPRNSSHSWPVIPTTQRSFEQIHIYRILGNDLPPRHKAGQVLQNVRFILENELKFPDTKKWWILNRIIDSHYENAIIELLKRYDQDFVRIPFEMDEYQKIDFRLEDFPESDFFHSYEYMNFSKNAKLRTIDYIYHDKNIYAMNNNGGRNAALAHGKSQPNARWIFPFDGNCFLTTNAFKEIMNQIDQWGKEYKYFVVPMARLLNNTQLLIDPDTRPQTPEEPQIIFRHDAEEKYNENMRYGRRSKLEMLWRLGVPSPHKILVKPAVPWETQDAPYLNSKNRYKMVGWVFRLFSGQVSQELNKKEASALRAFNRLLAVQDFMDGIDEHIARDIRGFDPNRLSLYNEKSLNQARLNYWLGDKNISKVVEVMMDKANEIVITAGNWYSSEVSLPIDSNNQVKFLQPKPDGDFEKNQLSNDEPNDPNSFNMDKFKLNAHNEFGQSITAAHITLPVVPTLQLFENITTLALAHHFSGNVHHARWAANLIRTFLLSSLGFGEQDEISLASYNNDIEIISNEGYSFPHLSKIPRIVPKFINSSKFPKDLLETDPSHFLDACRLLYRSKALTHSEFIELQSFASHWLEYLVSSPQGITMSCKSDHRGTLYDLQVLSLSGFTNDVRLYLRAANRLRMRIGKQFYVKDDAPLLGDLHNQPYEIQYVQNEINSSYENDIFKYTSLNLQYWMLITRIIQNTGISNDIWVYKSKYGQKLSKVIMGHLSKYWARHDDGINEMDEHEFILKPLIYIAQASHKVSDLKLGIWHEDGDEHDYFHAFLNKFDGQYFLHDNSELNDKRVGLGKEMRQQGIPPFWMFGIA